MNKKAGTKGGERSKWQEVRKIGTPQDDPGVEPPEAAREKPEESQKKPQEPKHK